MTINLFTVFRIPPDGRRKLVQGKTMCDVTMSENFLIRAVLQLILSLNKKVWLP